MGKGGDTEDEAQIVGAVTVAVNEILKIIDNFL